MVVKQKVPTCICGRAIDFPDGQIRHKCSCNAVWECGEEGYWYTQSISPIVARQKVSSVKPRVYPQTKRKKGRR